MMYFKDITYIRLSELKKRVVQLTKDRMVGIELRTFHIIIVN
jgi:hypothetical protein